MAIGLYSGVGCCCNVCGKQSDLIVYDAARYNQGGQEAYTQGLQTKAIAYGAKAGWITIERVIAHAGMPGGFYRNDIHVCAACVAEVRFATDKHSSKKKCKPIAKKKLT